jgi:hypothetical protein
MQKLGVTVQPISEREAGQDPRIGSENAGLIVRSVDPDGPSADKLMPRDFPGGLKTVKPGEVVSLRTFTVPGSDDPGAQRIVRIRVR